MEVSNALKIACGLSLMFLGVAGIGSTVVSDVQALISGFNPVAQKLTMVAQAASFPVFGTMAFAIFNN